jgi:hypothetical protein
MQLPAAPSIIAKDLLHVHHSPFIHACTEAGGHVCITGIFSLLARVAGVVCPLRSLLGMKWILAVTPSAFGSLAALLCPAKTITVTVLCYVLLLLLFTHVL